MKTYYQCDWHCPICNRRCEGVKGHNGEHQCPEHYIPQKSLSVGEKQLLRHLLWNHSDDLTEQIDNHEEFTLDDLRLLYMKLGGEKRW